ncbi:MAG TPA: V-type ATP synthase subunit F [Stellaceae bacterium]|nr:V-type ATP synthase subunit F [Stellaceae bacterium]
MGAIIFIGDELTATGFRLTGIETMTPAPAAVPGALAEARSRAGLVIITAELARQVPPAELEAALLSETPATAVIPDILSRSTPPDLTGRVKGALGIEN